MSSTVLQNTTPLRKAAILIATLDRVSADRLLDQMTEEQSRAVRDEVLQLDDIPLELQQAVLREFFGDSRPEILGDSPVDETEDRATSDGGVELDLHASEADAQVYDETWSRGAIAPQPEPTTSNPLAFLEEIEPEVLRTHLEPEHPQTIAVVLAHLGPRYAAALLAGFSPVVQADLARRIIDLEETDPAVLEDLAHSFTSIVETTVRKQRRRKTGINRLAEILAVASEPAERRILDNLDAARRDLTPRIAQVRKAAQPKSPDILPFVARPIPPIDVPDLQALAELSDDELLSVMQQVDAEVVVRALADDESGLTQRITRRLPRQQARMLERALQDAGPLRIADVASAKSELLEAAERLGLLNPTFRFQAA